MIKTVSFPCCIVYWKSIDISEEYVTFIFRVEERAKCCLLPASCWLLAWLILQPWDGGNMFLQNISWLKYHTEVKSVTETQKWPEYHSFMILVLVPTKSKNICFRNKQAHLATKQKNSHASLFCIQQNYTVASPFLSTQQGLSDHSNSRWPKTKLNFWHNMTSFDNTN
jgi:hypothetical protein